MIPSPSRKQPHCAPWESYKGCSSRTKTSRISQRLDWIYTRLWHNLPSTCRLHTFQFPGCHRAPVWVPRGAFRHAGESSGTSTPDLGSGHAAIWLTSRSRKSLRHLNSSCLGAILVSVSQIIFTRGPRSATSSPCSLPHWSTSPSSTATMQSSSQC